MRTEKNVSFIYWHLFFKLLMKYDTSEISKYIQIAKKKHKEGNLFQANEIYKLKKDKTGAIFVFERNNNLDFVKEDGDSINAELSIPIIEG